MSGGQLFSADLSQPRPPGIGLIHIGVSCCFDAGSVPGCLQLSVRQSVLSSRSPTQPRERRAPYFAKTWKSVDTPGSATLTCPASPSPSQHGEHGQKVSDSGPFSTWTLGVLMVGLLRLDTVQCQNDVMNRLRDSELMTRQSADTFWTLTWLAVSEEHIVPIVSESPARCRIAAADSRGYTL
jgi:hypothetical protein